MNIEKVNKILNKYKLLNETKEAINIYIDNNNDMMNTLSQEDIVMIDNTIESLHINRETIVNVDKTNINKQFGIFMDADVVNRKVKEMLAEKLITLKYLVEKKNIINLLKTTHNDVGMMGEMINNIKNLLVKIKIDESLIIYPKGIINN